MADLDATRDSPQLVEAMARARAQWPRIVIDDDTLRAWLVQRTDATTGLSSLHVGDLLLACACARGDSEALDAFRTVLDPAIAATSSRSHTGGTDPDELRQQVVVHLFVAEPGGVPRIAEYRGVGSLRTWVRVVASRLLLNAGRRKTARPDAFTSQIERDLGGADDPELDWLKSHYRAAFRQALTAVLAELPASDRSLLRLCVVNGLSATGVAALYRVDRSTAKRWLARVRNNVLQATRDRLRESLRVDPDELDSIMGLIGSRLDASVQRCLAGERADDGR